MNNAQKLTLRTHIQANTTQLPFGAGTAAINTVFAGASLNAGDAALIAEHYNAVASPDYLGWAVVEKPIIDAIIDKAAFTPTDAIPASPSTDLTYSNRAFLAQLKQTNAQWLTAGQGSLDARSASLRKNFQDCLRQLPTGISGANQDAGWGAPATPGAVRLGMQKKLTILEKVFVVAGSGSGNTGGDARGSATNPDVFVVSETISGDTIGDIKGLPA